MPNYIVYLDSDCLNDIQQITDWYNEKLQGFGSRFQKQAIHQINSLKKQPARYSVRYANVHCMLIKKFPFLV